MTVFDSMFRHRSGELDPSYAMIADHMPPSVRRSMLAGEMDINDANAARYARSADATLEAARVAGKAADGGSISVGKRADFVLLAGNPLDDISAVRRPVAVFKGDRWFDPALLYEAVGIRPFTR